jgi:hypothetical protein
MFAFVCKVIALTDCDEGLKIKDKSSFEIIATSSGKFMGNTNKHEFNLPVGDYSIACEDGGIPSYERVNFDGYGHYIRSASKGVKQWNVQGEPTCDAVDKDSIELPESMLHQRYEGEGPIAYENGTNPTWPIKVKDTDTGIRIPVSGSATYGPGK